MIGIDIIKASRMQHLMERFGDKGLRRFLLEDEIRLIKSYKTAAGFWAAKEAFSKALGTGIGAECSFFDIKIYKSEKGAPLFALSKKIIEKFKIIDAALSITHDGDYAISVVSIESLDSSSSDKIKQF
ncbi:holo-ACP synthase [Sulfurimonas sediminis]|uniref:Holo-[acyl-carrier-protein] synthase n=1 Tax=Sulfurimonas sediminis TaxID=2590020 RepID=A0A7M1B2V9_9BACT|nr:holo-ACP synthase [Sulfurimonas sediminis]QOP43846.1 holo-ACP synthase [Sulfurimonas sediminis]